MTAAVRHEHTGYDELLAVGESADLARQPIADQVQAILADSEKANHGATSGFCPARPALASLIEKRRLLLSLSPRTILSKPGMKPDLR